MKKALIPVAILAALALPGVASAHTPHVTPACDGLSIELANYEGDASNNVVSVQIVNSEGATSFQTSGFGSTFQMTYPWSEFQSHKWTVTVDANLHTGNATTYDRTWTGTWQACQVPPTTTLVPTTTVAATTTTVPVTTTTVTASTVAATTTAVVAVIDPPAPPDPTFPPADPIRPSLSDAPRVLPQTGASEFGLGVAIALVGGGAVLALIARRKAAR